MVSKSLGLWRVESLGAMHLVFEQSDKHKERSTDLFLHLSILHFSAYSSNSIITEGR
jgi:hypothetical protein